MSAATWTLAEAQAAIVDSLQPLTVIVEGLQVYGFMNTNPTPPSLDVYPVYPFQTGAAFGVANPQVFFTVRGRVSTVDTEAGQQLLLRMLDPQDPASVEAALQDVVSVTPDGVSGFREYVDDAATNGRLLGCEWRVTCFL